MELNRNPQNYFAKVEQAVFEPSNVVPGIGFSPDKVLQNRVLSYADALSAIARTAPFQLPQLDFTRHGPSDPPSTRSKCQAHTRRSTATAGNAATSAGAFALASTSSRQ